MAQLNINPKTVACMGLVVLALAVTAKKSNAAILYVDDSAAGANNGSSWSDAYNYLQDALADANSAAKPVEIRVAEGIYKPDQGVNQTPADREATFQLINGVTLKGGYAGYGEPDPNARDIEMYETILSGDLTGNDANVSDPCDLLDEPTRFENSFHVLTGSGTDATAMLDGFTITGGNAYRKVWDTDPKGHGGGMYSNSGSLKIVNCTFARNSALHGGGMYNYNGNATLHNCTFSRNLVYYVCGGCLCWGGAGAGMYNSNASPTLTHCTFSGNAGPVGGGMYNDQSHPALANCAFTGNSSDADMGGGMYSESSSPTLTNCTFNGNIGGGMENQLSVPTLTKCTFFKNSGVKGAALVSHRSTTTLLNCTFTANRASHSGGAMLNYQGYVVVTNCIFRGNSSEKRGGAMQNERTNPAVTNCMFTGNRSGETGGAICNRLGGNATLRNCILWGDTAPQGSEIALKETWTGAEPSKITVSHSDVMGGREAIYVGPGCTLNWTVGNIDVDPCFAEPGYWDPNGTPQDANDDFWVDGDYHLKSQAGRWDANEGRWAIDDVTSPCIDAGDMASPIGLEPFPNGGIINMGAYGGTAEASKSYFGQPVCETIVAGDINGDCIVNFKDFALMALHWLEGNRK